MPLALVASALEFFVCIPFGLYFWRRHRDSRLGRWLARIVIVLGLNGLQVFLELTLPPPVVGIDPAATAAAWLAPAWLAPAWVVVSLLNVLINGFFHYAILIVALLYNNIGNRTLTILLAAPLVATYLFGIDVRVNDLNYKLIAAWGAVYWLASAWLFVAAARQEQQGGGEGEFVRSSAVALLVMPPAAVLLVHQLQAGQGPLLLYIFASCIVSLGIFIFVYVRGSVAAIRRELLGRAARLEAAFVEHALKNGIAKVRLHALNARQALKAGRYEQVDEHAGRLLATADKMLKATKSVSQAGTAGLVVQPAWHDLQQLVDTALEPLTDMPAVRIVREDRPCQLLLDRRLVSECLTNVINNAVEAMDGAGTLTISLRETRRHAVLSIRDDGQGMNAWAVAHVFQPFFSSQRQAHYGNYGLGLAFVQAVLRAHRGRAEMASDPGEGAEVRLVFAKGEWQR